MITFGINTLQVNRLGSRSNKLLAGWASLYYILKSGTTWYRRETNTTGGYFKLWYSADAGVTWDELLNLDLTEESVIIDLAHEYRHRIVDEAYHVDRTLTATGYAGVEDTDWENLYSESSYWNPLIPLGGETPNFWYKEGTRNELTLPDAMGEDAATILPSYLTKNSGNEYAYVADNGTLDIYDQDFTLAVTSKTTTSSKAASRLLAGKARQTSTNGRYGIYALVTTGYIYCAVQSSVATYEITTNIDYTTLDWNTIRLEIDQTAKTISLYVNNVIYGDPLAFLGTFAHISNSYNFYIGCRTDLSFRSQSSYSDVIVLHRKLTSQEAIDFESGICPENCAAHWPCNSWMVNDISGNNYHMTNNLYNATCVAYGSRGSQYPLKKGYKLYTKFGSKNVYVPYSVAGTPVASPTIPAGYETFANYGRTGSTIDHNGADSMIVLPHAKWDRSNDTIYSDAARAGYYVAGTPKAWHPTELWALNMSDFFNVDQNRATYSKWHLTSDHLLDLFSYDTTKIDADFKKALTYSNNYDSYHTLAYEFNADHICTQRGLKILKNAGNVLYLSLDGGATYPYSIAQTGLVCRAKIYENGNIMWCTQIEAFYSTDNLATKNTATVLDINGDAFDPAATSNFTPLHENNIDNAGSTSVPDLFGMYSVTVGQQYDNVNLWCTTDYGVTIKSIYQFGVSDPVIETRHFHNINRNPADGSWWICTGDGNIDPDARIMRFLHNISENTWTWAQLTECLYTERFIILGAAFKDSWFIWGNDYQDIYRAPYSDITLTANHEKILLSGDGTSMYYDPVADVMICYLSNTGKTIYTSSDGGRTFRKSTLTGGPDMTGLGGYTQCINKNSNDYYRYEIIASTESVETFTQGTVLMIKVNKI